MSNSALPTALGLLTPTKPANPPGVRGSTIQLFNGHYFDYENPDSATIDIESVSHSLANTCRFTGHCREFYSVAQHCVLMSYYAVPERHAFYALMHEGGEPVCGDMNKPLKMLLPDYSRIENKANRSILLRFGLDPDAVPASIKPADYVMLATERRDLMPKKRAIGWDEWGLAKAWEPIPEEHWTDMAGIVPLPRKIRPWTPEQAKRAFLQRFIEVAFGGAGEQEGTLIHSMARVQAGGAR